MNELTPPKPDRSAYGREHIESLSQFLEALQERYRTEMADAEYLDWLQTLRNYKLAEVIDAANELTLNPPEGWTGLPKLPDVLRVIHRAREAQAEERRRDEGRKLIAEMKDLQKRKDSGEEFFSFADVLKGVSLERAAKPMPKVNTIWPDIDPDRNKQVLEQQKAALLASSGTPENPRKEQ